MTISWGYSPKIEKLVPLGDFPEDRYLIIAKNAIENLGWNLSHISSNGIIAYSPISLQSYAEEISIKIENNFAIVKSECVGIQLWFNDYGKNALNLEKFFHEFEYVEFHLKDVWEESLVQFHDFVATQDKDYFEKAPLTAKNKIKNVLYLIFPQRNYFVTPILVLINSFYYLFGQVLIVLIAGYLITTQKSISAMEDMGYYLGANNRELVLSGQYWRLISHQFVHGSFLHLFFNMYSLVYIGLMVEHKLGVRKYLTVYLISGLFGGMLSLVYHETGYMLGASGAIMGLFGAFLALLVSKAFEKNATRALVISTVFVVVIMLLNGLKQNVDNAAHIGGLISGFVSCYVLHNEKLFRRKFSLKARYALVVVFSLISSFLVFYFTSNFQTKELLVLEQKLYQNMLDYNEVYRMPRNLPKEEKLKLIQKNGIEMWQKNELLVKQMLSLKLSKKQRLKAEFQKEITALNLEISKLLYKEIKEGTFAYRHRIQVLTNDINNLRLETGRNELAK